MFEAEPNIDDVNATPREAPTADRAVLRHAQAATGPNSHVRAPPQITRSVALADRTKRDARQAA